MAINSTGLQPDQGANEGNNSLKGQLASEVLDALSLISLRCVECSQLYPALEAGRTPRYRCDCGSVLDVEMAFQLPSRPVQQDNDTFFRLATEQEHMPSAGAVWRQIFDERASTPPI